MLYGRPGVARLYKRAAWQNETCPTTTPICTRDTPTSSRGKRKRQGEKGNYAPCSLPTSENPTVTDPDPSRAQPKRKLFSKTCVRLCRGSKNNESDGYWGLIDGIRLILLHVLFSTIQSTRLSPRDGDFGLCSRERGGGGCPSESKAVLERSSLCFLFFLGGGVLLFPRQGGKPDQIKPLGRSLLHVAHCCTPN